VVGKVFPLEQAREAYTLMQEGKNYGKIVLKIRFGISFFTDICDIPSAASTFGDATKPAN